ncbi:MAG: caspase family protein [Phaeodactylibacter sp.]|nr:caspase family protein [Phaeodactylibacter sp.]MCB9052148.1 caspase family protein [Lewinellaceae bacterium]
MAHKGIDIGEAEPAGMERPQGINYMLAIAIDEYQHCPRLYNCVQDARRLIDVLSGQYQFEKQHVFTLFNEQATEHAIIDRFKKMVELVRPQDNLLILFSGHGEYEEAIDEGYWIPVDAPMGHTNEYIANSRIVKYIKAIHSHHTFLIVDSCFSGSLFANRSLEQAADANRLDEIPSRWLLTAGRNEVVSDGKPGSHSPFADNVIYFLENNPEPQLSVAGLISMVVNAVIHNSRQTPRGEPLQDVGHRGGQFYFYRKGAVPKPRSAVPASTGTTSATKPPPRPNYKKYILAAIAALVVIAMVVWLANRQEAGKKVAKTEQASSKPLPLSPQERYDSLLTAGVERAKLALTPEQYQEACRLLSQALRWAESNGLDRERAEKSLQKCQKMLAEAELETPPVNPKEEHPAPKPSPPQDYATLLTRGQSLFREGKFAAASQALKEALKINPEGKAARNYLLQCQEELDWERAASSATEEGYRAYLNAHADGKHAEAAKQKIAALYRYELYFTTALKGSNQLSINVGRGKPPFDITITYLATGEQIRKTAQDTQPFEVSLSSFNSQEGNHMVEIVVRDSNFKAKGQKMPLMK